MNDSPRPILGLVPLATSRGTGAQRKDLPRDIQWGTPIFRAPMLPTPNQLYGELPFTANLPRRFRTRA